MIVFAKGFISDSDALGPYIDAQTRVVGQLKAEGLRTAIYRRANGPGVYLILEGQSIHAVQERVTSFPCVVEGLVSVEYEGPPNLRRSAEQRAAAALISDYVRHGADCVANNGNARRSLEFAQAISFGFLSTWIPRCRRSLSSRVCIRMVCSVRDPPRAASLCSSESRSRQQAS